MTKNNTIDHETGQCGCGDFHKYDLVRGEYEECPSCGCNAYPVCLDIWSE